MKTISIVTPCYNEEGNVALVAERVRAVFENLPDYTFEHIFADNRSTDTTLSLLKDLAKEDKRIKIIANSANFGALSLPSGCCADSEAKRLNSRSRDSTLNDAKL